MKIRNSTKGDVLGGSVAGLLSLPESVAFGALVFGSINPELTSLGVIAGLVALSVSNLIGAFFGGVRIMSTGPYSMACLMLVSSMAILTDKVPGLSEQTDVAILFLLILVLISGSLQVIFGWLRLGNLAKYIPYPVVAGLMNGLAILVLLGQVKPILGLDAEVGLAWHAIVNQGQPLTLLVGLLTILAMIAGKRWVKKIPPAALGILVGTAAYYLISMLFPEGRLGLTVGTIPLGIPLPRYTPELMSFVMSDLFWSNAGTLVALAFGIAVVSSLRTLLSAVAIDEVTQERSDTNRELLSQGIANMLGSLFGAVTVAGYSGQSLANHANGGRTRLARLCVGLFALGVLVGLGPLVGKIPIVVLAGMLVMVAYGAFDSWSMELVKRVAREKSSRKALMMEAGMVLLVTGVMVFVGIFEGVGIGLLLSLFLFVYRMSKNTIRRRYDASRIRSNVERDIEEILYLEREGRHIRIFELEGSLFFGSADPLLDAVVTLDAEQTQYFILDFKRVTDVDSTGIKVLMQLRDQLKKRDILLLISSVDRSSRLGREFFQFGFMDQFGAASIFRDIGRALAFAEDMLLNRHFEADRYDRKLQLHEIDCLARLQHADRNILSSILQEEIFEDRAVVFNQGDEGKKVFFVAQGRLNLLVRSTTEKGRDGHVIATLCPGTVCGEMAVIDGASRAASAVARGKVVLYGLALTDIEKLKSRAPETVLNLTASLAQELSKRIRIANGQNAELRT